MYIGGINIGRAYFKQASSDKSLVQVRTDLHFATQKVRVRVYCGIRILLSAKN